MKTALPLHNSAQNSSKTADCQNLPAQEAGRAEQKRQWLSDAELESIDQFLQTRKNKSHRLIFKLSLSTGRNISELLNLTFDDLNARTQSLIIKNQRIAIPKNLAKELLSMRDKSSAPDQKIISLKYCGVFRILKTALFRAGVTTPQACRLVRNTFVRRHWQSYQNKELLKRAIGVNSLRRLPKSLFIQKEVPVINLFPAIV